MKKPFFIIFILLSTGYHLFAQRKIEGSYNASYQTFIPKNNHILVKEFRNDNLAPFMIMGKNPHYADSNHVGFIDTSGRIIIKPRYSNCSFFVSDYALVIIAGKSYNDDKWGLINKQGKTIIPIEYQRLSKCHNGLFLAVKNNKIGFINIHNNIIVPFGKYSTYTSPPTVWGNDEPDTNFYWDELALYNSIPFHRYIGVRSGNKWAVIDSTGKEIISPKFDAIGIFSNNIAPAEISKKYGVIDTVGNMIIPALYDRIELVTGKDYLYFYNGQKVGVLSLNNTLIIPSQFSSITPFGNGFTANDEHKSVLFDVDGKQIAEAHYPEANFPVWGRKEDGFFVYNSSDKKYHPYQNIDGHVGAYKNPDKCLLYNRDNKWGVMDSVGREITPPLFDSFDREKLNMINGRHQLIAVIKNNKWGILNSNGKTLLNVIYDQLKIDNGKLLVKRNRKYGLFNRNLKQLTQIKYDSLVVTYPEQLYNVTANSPYFIYARIKHKWGLIDNNGKEIVPFKYDKIVWVYYNLVLVKNDNQFGIVNIQGKQLADCIYDNISFEGTGGISYHYKNFLTLKDGLHGLIDSNGTVLAQPVYESITPLREKGKYEIKKEGKFGMLDDSFGHIIIPCEYQYIRFDNYDDGRYHHPPFIFSDYLLARQNDHFGLIDSVGKVCLPFIYDSIDTQNDGYFPKLNGKQGCLDKNLKWIVPPKYYYIMLNSKNIYVVHTYSNLIGLVNKNGHVVADSVYNSYAFCGDTIILRKNDKFGTIDLEGKAIDPFIYSSIVCSDGRLIKRAALNSKQISQ